MDQEPSVPKDLPAETSRKEVDINKILLPNKEIHSPASAQRINAGALLEQEQRAAQEGPTTEAAQSTVSPEVSPPAAPVLVKKDEEAVVKPIETYKSDIEDLVKDKNISVLSIAAAEAERRAAAGPQASAAMSGVDKEEKRHVGIRLLMIILGAVLVIAAAGALLYVFGAFTSSPPAQQTTPQTPFIPVNGSVVVTITPGELPSSILADLNTAKNGVSLSLGLMSQLLVEESSTTPSGGTVLAPLDAPMFLSTIAPDAPQSLLLTLQPQYLLGAHVYDGNQAFLMLSVDSYEQAFSGMLAWEPTMQSDLSPLFTYTPPPSIPEQILTTSTPTTPEFLQTGFVDDIVDNHDARVVEDRSGTIVLLWTFLDNDTIVITTNEATLSEIISLLQTAPVNPVPGQ